MRSHNVAQSPLATEASLLRSAWFEAREVRLRSVDAGQGDSRSVDSFRFGIVTSLVAIFLMSSTARAQTGTGPSEEAQARPAPVAASTPVSAVTSVPQDRLSRWLDIQNAALAVRYRYIDNSAGSITANLMQHRESVRGQFK